MSVVLEVETKEMETEEALLAVVKSRNSDNEQWKEVAEIISFTAGGAGFYMERECKVGTLVSMMLALPEQLRCYDHDKELYRVWGLVQFCQPLKDGDQDLYHIGVAFIGKDCPESYNEDPEQSYRVKGMTEDGLWRIEEAKTSFQPRRQLRYWAEVDLYLALVDAKRDAVKGERTRTENISRSGAAVYTTLSNVGVGDKVKFISEQYDFSGLALVCNRQSGKDKRTRLHLQFVDSQFPVEQLKTDNKRP